MISLTVLILNLLYQKTYSYSECRASNWNC